MNQELADKARKLVVANDSLGETIVRLREDNQEDLAFALELTTVNELLYNLGPLCFLDALYEYYTELVEDNTTCEPHKNMSKNQLAGVARLMELEEQSMEMPE